MPCHVCAHVWAQSCSGFSAAHSLVSFHKLVINWLFRCKYFGQNMVNLFSCACSEILKFVYRFVSSWECSALQFLSRGAGLEQVCPRRLASPAWPLSEGTLSALGFSHLLCGLEPCSRATQIDLLLPRGAVPQVPLHGHSCFNGLCRDTRLCVPVRAEVGQGTGRRTRAFPSPGAVGSPADPHVPHPCLCRFTTAR